MSTPLTDQEIICEWMEPGEVAWLHDSARSIGGWWVRDKSDIAGCVYVGPKRPRILDLDALWKVEERLTREQCEEYTVALVDSTRIGTVEYGGAQCHRWHADALTRVKSLAHVLRPVVEGTQ